MPALPAPALPEGDRDQRQVAIVTTTVRVPHALAGYLDQFRRLRHRPPLVVVVGDRRTPPGVRGWLDRLDASAGRVVYLGIDEQHQLARRFPALAELLPWDSIQRRNLGYVFAAERGCEVIISVDDDNYVTGADFLTHHATVGRRRQAVVVESSNGWWNVCDVLETTPPYPITPRGFPQRHRLASPSVTTRTATVDVVVNAGLWLDDPDVDAVTRMVAPVAVAGVKPGARLPVALARGTCCPFNSQNTAFDARLLPCMYLVVMGRPYRGMRTGRYDDVWMSYLAKAVIDHLGDAVCFGEPFVSQRRNEHDLLDDLAAELPGMMLTGLLTDLLCQVTLTERTYLTAYLELIDGLRAAAAAPRACRPEAREFLSHMLDGMEVWARTCEEMGWR